MTDIDSGAPLSGRVRITLNDFEVVSIAMGFEILNIESDVVVDLEVTTLN